NLRWGLIPFFAKDASIGQKMINARAETVAEKPSFRAAFKRRRCLVLADGFYEWKAMPDGKQPFHIARPKGQPFVFAGLYEIWKHGGGEPVRSCTIITTPANATLRALHDRMPVILEGADLDLWLDPGIQSLDSLAPLLSSVDDDYLSYRPVSRRVGNVRNDDVSLLEE
ncbi:MAG: SOS response-associated peptidase, partial [Salinibacterium sp.]|nr:SOS response-associated peptidase [Salinibacterium sp.]